MESFMAICACADVRVSGRDATQGSERRKTTSRRPRAPNRFWGPVWTARSSEMHGRPYDGAPAAAGRPPGEFRGRIDAPRSEQLLWLLRARARCRLLRRDGEQPWQGPAAFFSALGGTAGVKKVAQI